MFLIKNCPINRGLNQAALIFYKINRKIGIEKLSSLFVIIFIIDLTIGNLVVSILHDSIDYLNPFWDFGPVVGLT